MKQLELTPSQIEDRAEHDRQQEAAKAARQADDSARPHPSCPGNSSPIYLNVDAMPNANAMPSANSRAVKTQRRQRDHEAPWAVHRVDDQFGPGIG